MANTPAELVQARESFYGAFGEVHAGDLFWSDDPVVKATPTMFGPPTVRETPGRASKPAVEQATAAPGEKRAR